MDSINKGVFPVQKLPLSKKTEPWKHACVDAIIGREGGGYVNGRSRYQRMKIDYDLYNGIYDPKDLKYVTNPYDMDDGFPAIPQDINVIRPRINLLVGEETKRPFNFKIIQTNDEATSKLQDKAKELLFEYVTEYIQSTLSPEEQQRYAESQRNGEIMTPDAIKKYLSSSYKDIAEETAYHSLNYLRNKLNLDHEFMKGWQDALIGGEEIYYVGIQNGEPYMERVNPLFFTYDKSPDIEFVEDGDWCLRRMYMTPSEIYDRFYDKIGKKDLDNILNSVGGPSYTNRPDQVNTSTVVYRDRIVTPLDPDESYQGSLLNVWHVCWKSYKRIGFLKTVDEEGQEKEVIVDEDYEVKKSDKIEWDWIIEVWEGYRIGEDIYIGIGPVKYQHVSIDNPNAQKLPYTGVRYSNINSRSRSLVDIMKSLQYMYIILWYRLELALARDKGKVINMDVTQIPKSMGIDVNKWLHYLSAIGVNLINPYEEGWDIPGREGGKPASFNQISGVDLTMTNVIAQYIQLMDKIEEMIDNLSGVTKQRQGTISQNELVGNVQRSVVQSSHITEPLFWYHNQVKRRAYTMLLDTAKVAWKQSNKKKLQYLLDDTTRIFIDIAEDFFNADLGIFVTDSTKESQDIEALKNLIQPAMQNGATLLDAANILTNDNMSSIKATLRRLDEEKAQREQAAADAEQQRQAQLIQMQNDVKSKELEMKQTELELERYKVDTDNQTKLEIAQLQAEQKNADREFGSMPDPIALHKLQQDDRKLEMDMIAKQYDNEMSMMENKNKLQIMELELRAKENDTILQKAMADRDLTMKDLEAKTKVNEMRINSEIKDKELVIKALEAELKDSEINLKREELNLKSAETDLKRTENDLKKDEIQIKNDEVTIKAQVADDNYEIENKKIAIEKQKVKSENEANKIDLEIEKVKLQQGAMDIEKSKVDTHKTIVTTNMAIKKSKEIPKTSAKE